jgi:hypothetical protein
VSGAWAFLAGWISATLFIGGGIAWHAHRTNRRQWLDAQDSSLFADGCKRFTEAGGI